MEEKQLIVSRRMEWWEKVTLSMKKVWTGVATRLGIRKNGILKLRHDVRTCEYEDVQVMWEMLRRNETETARSPVKSVKSKKKPFWNFFEWTACTPYLCRSV